MDNVDFQNGFLCGMATKGLTRSGQLYQPRCWNDEGIYEYFYIDFKQSVAPFSLGMWNESIVVHDSEQLAVTETEYVSLGVYKIHCNVTDRMAGVTVVNKKSTLLSFAGGRLLPVFSVMFYVAGLESYVRKAYAYEVALLPNIGFSALEMVSTNFASYATTAAHDVMPYSPMQLTAAETVGISYWPV